MKELLSNKINGDTMIDNRRDRISFENMVEREIEECKKEIEEMENLEDKNTDTER